MIPTYLSTESLMLFLHKTLKMWRLEHIQHGPKGMDFIVKFLNSLDLVSLPLNRMNQKMENL